MTLHVFNLFYSKSSQVVDLAYTILNRLQAGDTPCDFFFSVQEHCSFNGSWDGGRGEGQKVFYISSYFWDRALDIGIIKDKDASKFETTPNVSKYLIPQTH